MSILPSIRISSIFYTVNQHRPVHGGGGIVPDLKTDIEKPSAFINMLWKKGIFIKPSAKKLEIVPNEKTGNHHIRIIIDAFI